MEQELQQDILRKLKRRKVKRFWTRLVSVMMCVVVFCTTYALILPAITQETDTFCGLEAHVHTSDCYPQQSELICEFAETELHTHTDACQPVTETNPVCGQEAVEGHAHTETCVVLEEKPLVCTLEETEGHAHTETCELQEVTNLTCTLEETEGHAHTDACAPQQVTNLTCTLEAVEGHTHTDTCQRLEERDLTCTLAETQGHTHTPDCSSTETVLVCTQAESQGHAHGGECYTQALICGLAEDETHAHGGECYTQQLTCTQAETSGHAHGGECYGEKTTNVCGLAEEAAHTHGEGCYTVTVSYGCGLEETEGHAHGEACRTVTITYGCGLEETEGHAHGDECRTVTTCYSCGLEAVEPHTHGEQCYTTLYSCGLEEIQGHSHTEECYPTVYGCGLEETDHVHTEECYAPSAALICQLEEDETHTHGADCYDGLPECQLEEHEHELQCYSDPNADVETAAYWESTLPGGLTGNAAEDLLAVAKSQLGYTESSRNYMVDESGAVKGYTRYGAWYGSPYGDWCAMYVSFCLNYAQVELMPQDALCSDWVNKLQGAGLYASAGDHTPNAGDIIFFDGNGDGTADHVGIVAQYFPGEEHEAARIQTIEGNRDNTVCYATYNQADPSILGYGLLPGTQIPEEDETVEIEENDIPLGGGSAAWAVLVDPEGAAEGEFPAEASAYGRARTGVTLMSTPRAAPLELTPYINSVTMYDSKGKPIASGATVTEGDLIQFEIEYTITGQQLGVMNGQNVSVTSDTLTYDLPKVFKVVRSDSGNIVNSAGQTVGQYVIDSTNGTITMKFLETYVKENAKGMQIHGNISFYSTVVKVNDDELENQEYKFTDQIVLGVVIQEEDETRGDLSIEKQKISVNGEELEFELKVTSAEGTNGPVTITDKMSEGLTFKEGEGVWKGTTKLNNVSFTPSSDKSSFTMTLPEMAAGESYTIRYKCQADIKLLDADMTVSNTATVTGKNSDNVELKDDVTVGHTFEVLKKTGVRNDDGSISWTITVNQAKADISGWVLSDIVAGNTPYTGSVTIKGSDGKTVTANLPYTFPNGSKDTYEITYTTKHGFDQGASISNKAILTYNNTETSVETNVGLGTPFQKSGSVGQMIEAADGTKLVPITWTVTIDTTNGSIPAGEKIVDRLYGSYIPADMYMTYDQLMAALSAVETALNNAGSGVSTVEAQAHAPFYSGGAHYNENDLRNNAQCRDLNYERFALTLSKDIPAGKVITFSYEAYGIFPDNLPVDSDFKNRISLGDFYEVEAVANYRAGTIKAIKYGLRYFDPASYEKGFDWGPFVWESANGTLELEYEKLHDGYLAWAIGMMAYPGYSSDLDVVLYENLPEGVTVKGVELPFFDNVPTTPLELWDLIPGNTYEWNFKMGTPEQYASYNPTREIDVTITVKLTTDGDLEVRIPGKVFTTMSRFIELRYPSPGSNAYGYLHVYTQIDEDYEWTPTGENPYVYLDTFTNEFTLTRGNNEVMAAEKQTQKISKDERDGVIQKKATMDNNNIITYSVVLNGYGRDLIENATTLNIHDELTYTSTAARNLRLRLVPGSVKLYEIKYMASDGSYVKGDELTVNYRYAENSTENRGTTTWTHTIDLAVPDSKAMVLEYSYKATGEVDGTHNVGNKCTITGVGDGGVNADKKLEIEVKQASAQANTKGVMLYKVDADSDGIFLEKARFNIYIWNAEQNQYIIVHHPDNGGTDFVTDANGMIVLDTSTMKADQFAYNTAYYIVEVESPNGYYVSPEKYYFQIVNEDKVAHPPCLPNGFTGRALTSGDIIYRQNVSETTEISVEKYWKDYGGNPVTVTGKEVKEVTIELWQELEGKPESAKLYGTYTMTPDEDGNWALTITDLPKAVKNSDGTRGTSYLYYIKEVKVGGYELVEAENNHGILSGVIKLFNQKQIGYVLPKTGGPGTQLYTTAGLLLMLTSAAFLMYSRKPRRREDL